MPIYGNMIGGGAAPLKTLILEDENGNEFFGVVTDSAQLLTANAKNDIRSGTVAVTDEGIVTGSKEILEYRTTAAYRGILPGKSFTIPLSDHNKYDYTKLQCIIVKFNTSFSDSTSAEKIVINDGVYNVGSGEKIASVTKNEETQSIDLNITNTTENRYYIHYFTYREEEN